MPEEKKKQDQSSKADSLEKAKGGKPESPSSSVASSEWEKALKHYEDALRMAVPDYLIRKDWTKTEVDIGNLWLKDTLHSTWVRPQVDELESEISKLKSEINQKAQALLEQTVDAKQKESQISELK